MINIILLLTIALIATVDFFMLTSSYLHIFQLNHYKPIFQLKWTKTNALKILYKTIWLVIAIPVFFLGDFGYPAKKIFVLMLLITFLFNKQKQAKKPLVYTNRIKRMIIAGYLFTAVVLLILRLINASETIMLSAVALIEFLLPLLILVFDFMNKPINTLINKWYINDAKRIIKEMPNLIVIGVTGSYGKTSMKNYLYKLLSSKYNVLITPENYNTTLGVVKTIRNNLKATHDIFVCEMGACNVGDIKEICDIVKPKFGVITSIGPQHLESFKTIENIIDTKFELADSLPDNGVVFLNYDNEYIKSKKIIKKYVTYGTNNKENDYNAYNIKYSNNGLDFEIQKLTGEKQEINSKLIGEHNVINICGAIAVANYLGIDMKTLSQKARQLEGVQHRLQLIKANNNLIIDDAYNSNPNGAKSALQTLKLFDGIKILVTPGMIELGEKQYECNYNFGKQASEVCDYIVLVGEKQTKPIYDGIVSNNYNKEKIIIVEDIQDGLNEVYSINSNGEQKVILLENDLPDNY